MTVLGLSRYCLMRTSLTLQPQSDVWCQVCYSRLTTEHCQDTWSCRRIPHIKVDTIRSSMIWSYAPDASQLCHSVLPNYSSVTTADISRLLVQAPNKQCSLDPCPTWLVKSLSIMPDIITKLVNTSLQSGTFPSSQRHALVTPVLKKQHLDPTIIGADLAIGGPGGRLPLRA